MATNNMVLNRLFTQNTLYKMINGVEEDIYSDIVKRYTDQYEEKYNYELINEIYKYMSKSYRNEYFYKNTLLNKLLLGKHSIATTTALTEISIGKSKADFILINGKAVVYEIKSELDSFDRLESQLNDYYKAFNHVCVVASESNFDKLYSILSNSPVGIYVITKKTTISNKLKKEPIEYNDSLDYNAMFKVLHKHEYEKILLSYYKQLPDAPQVFYYDECFNMFSKIPLNTLYKTYVKQIKRRNLLKNNTLNNVPYELKSLVYFSYQSSIKIDKLNVFLGSKYRG